MARRHGPARPRAIGCEGAGGSVIPSQSRQENFSRTCPTTFQRRGSHSSDSVIASPSLRRFTPPHLPRRIDDALAWKMFRQWPARRLDPCPFARLSLLLRSGDLGLGLFLGLRLLEIDDGEFKLFDEVFAALRGLPELLPPSLGEQELQPLDLKHPNLRLAARFRQHLALDKDLRAGRGKIYWERIGRRRHNAS